MGQCCTDLSGDSIDLYSRHLDWLHNLAAYLVIAWLDKRTPA
jgi:hypothetical protein